MHRSSSQPTKIPTRRRSGGALAFAAAGLLLVAAGCGGGAKRGAAPRPKLDRADAAQLILLADVVARDAARDPCGAAKEVDRLRTRAIALVNAHRVPAALQDPLMSGVNALVALRPVCAPPPLPVATTTPAPQSTRSSDRRGHGRHGHGHGHGHGDGGDD